MAFKDNLYYFRTKHGMTQSELASKCGVTQQAIHSYEVGVRSPNAETIKVLAASLECTANDLVYGPDTAKEVRT